MNHWLLAITILIVSATVYLLHTYLRHSTEGFADYKSDSEYLKQVQLLTDTYSAASNGKRPLQEGVGDMPAADQIFVNFHSLGCRFTGFIGPYENNYYDPDIAVQNAVAAGCRTFILEIDYISSCNGDKKYFPTLVVRDKQGKLFTKRTSVKDKCNSQDYSMIRETCEKINFYAFADSCQNKTDPVVVVLYFLRKPPGDYKSKGVLNYYSQVAKLLAPLSDRFLQNEPTGTYYRQRQEGQLLMNKITAYSGKVLLFSNANTIGFREDQSYSSNEDLDFLVNLRLSYSQTKLGITDNASGSTFGALETAEDYMIIPTDRSETMKEQTKLKWTVCLSTDPFKTVPQATYDKITKTYGVHCVPITIYDIPANQYMFSEKRFKTYSFIPKLPELRYTKPPVAVPAEPSLTTNANQGKLRTPKI